MKRKFVTFADSRMTRALARIRKQAQAMDFFDEIETWTEKELDDEYRNRHARWLKPGVRGFGYWIWKPYVIWRALQQMSAGDELYYVDAGCHFNPEGRARMLEYSTMLRANPMGLAGFELTPDCSVRSFTKMDLLDYMGVRDNDEILKRAQICATHVFCIKSEKTMKLLERWIQVCENMHLLDDTPSILPNLPCFVEHRHDQSVFTLLCIEYGALLLPGEETWPANNTRNWSTMRNYPIWDKRDLGITSHLISRVMHKVRKKIDRWSKRFSG